MADRPVFAIHAVGYPMPMFVGCAETVGPFLERDLAALGSTQHWELRVVRGSCHHCTAAEADAPSNGRSTDG